MYIDPGTGSMIIQALVATIPVIMVFLLSFRNKIRALFGKPPVEPKKKKGIESKKTETKTDDFEDIDNE